MSILTFIVILGAIVLMNVTDQKGYDEFKQKFKSCQSQVFIEFLIFYRITLGLFCAVKTD